jgi:hypothetical protein
MTPDRTKPGLAFYATIILLVVLVLYPLSFGPACWISSRTTLGRETIKAAYFPISRLWKRGPEPIADAINWYCYIGAARGWYWGDPSKPRMLGRGTIHNRVIPRFR